MNRPQIWIALALLATVAIILLLATAGSREDERLVQRASAQHAQSLEVGAALYAEHCRSCHGARGEGVGQLGPPLNDQAFFEMRLDEVGWPDSLEDYVIATVAKGRVVATRPNYAGDGTQVMAAWSLDYGGPLRADEIRDVAAFVLNWEATALGEFAPAELVLPTPTPESSAQRASRGQEVFLSAGCADCHTVEGISEGDVGPDLTGIASRAGDRVPELAAEDYLRESFLLPNAYVVDGYEPGLGCGGILSHLQLDDLVAFLMTLE